MSVWTRFELTERWGPEMLDRADAILKLALAVAAITVAAALGYYYGIFLPAQASAAAQLAADAKKTEREQAEKADSKRQANADNAKQQYDLCLAAAQSDYNSRWESSCKTIHDRQLQARNDCYAGSGDTSYCSSYVVTPARECTLPSMTADNYDKGLQSDKRLCFDKMAVTTGQTAALTPPAR